MRAFFDRLGYYCVYSSYPFMGIDSFLGVRGVDGHRHFGIGLRVLPP